MARTLSADVRERILDAAKGILLAAGIEALTVEEVAKRSGAAKTTIYRHFPGGAAQVLVSAMDSILEPFPAPDTGSLRGDLLAFARIAVPAYAQPNVRRLVLGLIYQSASDTELERIHQEAVNERKLPLWTILRAAQQRGELPADLDFEIAFELIEGPFMARWLLSSEPANGWDLEAVLDRVIAALRA